MNINFYLNDSANTLITSIKNIASNPYKLGDIIELSVEDVRSVDYEAFDESVKTKIIDSHKNFQSKFDLKAIKLVKEQKFLKIKVKKEDELTIDYYCVFSK